MVHVGAHVEAVDAPEARRVQVEIEVELLEDEVEQLVDEDLAAVAVRATREDAIEVLAVVEATLMSKEAYGSANMCLKAPRLQVFSGGSPWFLSSQIANLSFTRCFWSGMRARTRTCELIARIYDCEDI